jgi:hypothetical protein
MSHPKQTSYELHGNITQIRKIFKTKMSSIINWMFPPATKNIKPTTTTTADNNTTTNTTTPKQQKGTDSTYHVSDLLKYTSRTIEWNNTNPVTFEAIPDVEGAFLLHNVLTPEECQQMIDISEEMGYAPSPLTILDGNYQNSQINQNTKQIRDSWRVLCDVPTDYNQIVSQRVVDLLPQQVTVKEGIVATWNLDRDVPVNPRWRFNRYDNGQKFGPHLDAGYTKNINEKTLLTFIVYLNEGFQGGETKFFPGGKRFFYEKVPSTKEVVITPKCGTALVFFQAGELNHRHEGSPLIGDMPKYILRSDIAYKRENPV